ncbi:unnamed protein product [Rotaria sordida]|uniref:Uncharacterized protein n=1 Tax=Rotaria sordida TaxID=392033 RepID=A0A819IBE7_9BILA|nr:unnamed protein product [Rotaria sordida]CAF3910857.1 unnamed protein product [Rotaria sordida]
MVDVLYSLVNVNERFNRLIFDSLYIHHLDMTINSSFDHIIPIDKQISRICEKILPRIQHQIERLTVEPHSIKPILSFNYPQLYSLSLVNFPEKMFLRYFTDDLFRHDLFAKKITHLNINILNKTPKEYWAVRTYFFTSILSLCKRLINLNFCYFSDQDLTVSIYNLPPPSFKSSTLTNLKINVDIIDDCLDLLDGRLNCLSTLIIKITQISSTISNTDNITKLPKLKYFSLISYKYTSYYDDLVCPLLHRMINLEELKLYLFVRRFDSIYIDGIQLYDQILIYMPRLNKFTFSIKTFVVNKNIRINLSSNENIQYSFIGKKYGQVGSYVHTWSMETKGECHIYSIPYEFEYFHDLSISFPGGMFHKVRNLIMEDTHPFEHKLFKIISQDFHFLQYLYIYNDESEKYKEDSFPLITFPNLTLLDIQFAHINYVEQFLLKKYTHLPNLLNLYIRYESLEKITNNFINDVVHLNFDKLKDLHILELFVGSESFHKYFAFL